MKISKLFFYYPIAVAIIGVIIHLFNTLQLFQLEVPQRNHAFMLAIDLLVALGLLKRAAFGYWLAILLFIQQSIMQPYWAYVNYLKGDGLFQLFVTSPIVITALVVLILNKELFIRLNKD